MSGLAIKFLDQDLHRVIFDAMPMPVFVVDEDVSILEYNSAAARLLGNNKEAILRRRGGDVLHCVNSLLSPLGCGHASDCKKCVVRKAVRCASEGGDVTREWARLELLAEGKSQSFDVRVSTKPFKYDQHSFVLLILEGLNEPPLPGKLVPKARRSPRAT